MAARVTTAAQKAAKSTGWFARQRDMPEVYVLGGMVGFVLGGAAYSLKRVYFNNEAGSYTDVNLRGNPFKQTEAGRVGYEDPAKGKHSFWWHVAQIKMDEDGANVGVLWDNRTRPHQYSKPGMQGMGAGIPTA